MSFLVCVLIAAMAQRRIRNRIRVETVHPGQYRVEVQNQLFDEWLVLTCVLNRCERIRRQE
jgi:hypothetical protein